MAKNEDFFAFMDFTKQTLGLEESVANRYALELSRNFGGEYLYITNQVDRMNRDLKIRSEYQRGIHINQLAEQYQLSSRQIYNIISG